MSENRNSKKVMSGLLALAMVAGSIPANVVGIVASADTNGASSAAAVDVATTDEETTAEESSVAKEWKVTWNWDDTDVAIARFTNKTTGKKTTVVADGDDIVCKTTEATCTKDGSTVYTATVVFMGETFTDEMVTDVKPATGHTYGEPAWTWTKTDKGFTASAKFSCKQGDDDVIVEADDITTDSADATCEEAGGTKYNAKVTFEGKEYTDSKIDETTPALGHDYGEPTWTYLDDGTPVATFTCARCNEKVDVKGTVETKVVTAATCTEAGKKNVIATVEFNGKTYTDEQTIPIPATGHDYDITWTWKNDTTAVAFLECNNCDEVYKKTVTAVLTETIPATCENEGAYVYTATLNYDGKEFIDTHEVKIAKLDHEFGKVEYAPTATVDGYTMTATRKCANCPETEKETVDGVYTVVKEATVNAKGVGRYTFTFKNKAFETKTIDVDIAMIDKNYADPVYTWSEDLSKVTGYRKCLNGSSENDLTVEAAVTSAVTKEATCTSKGETTYTAKFEDDRFSTQVKTLDNIDMIPHSYSAPVWDWTPSDNGYAAKVTFTCKKCGDIEELDADVTSAEDNGIITYTGSVEFEGNKYVASIKAVAPVSKTPVVSFEKGDYSVKLTWTKVKGATKYGIVGYVNGAWKVLDQGFATSYVLNNLKPGTNYKVAVVAMLNGDWNMDFSNAITVTPNESKVPEVSFEKGDGAVKLTWTTVANATQYGVVGYKDGEWIMLGKGTGTNYVLENLREGINYRISVIAYVDGQWNKDYSNAITVTPNVNKVPTVSFEKGEGSVKLSWNAITGATKYGICGYKNGEWVMLNQGTTTNFVLGNLKEDTNYRVSVIAFVDGAWNKDFSNAITVTPEINKVPTVTFEKGDGAVKLSWTAVTGAAKYGIAAYKDGAWTIIDQGSTTSYVLNNLKAGINYRVAIVAMIDGKWNKDFSNAITVTPNAPVNPYPDVQTAVKDNKIGLKWNAVPGAQKYAIAVFQANKWVVKKQVEGNVTTWTTPQVRSGKYKLAVVAKVNGKWVTAQAAAHAVDVTVKDSTTAK